MIFDTDPLYRAEDWQHVKRRLPRFLTNMNGRLADIVLEAAEITGFDIEIRDSADEVIREVGDTIAIYTYEPSSRDHSPFWETVHELEAPLLQYGWCRLCELAEATGPDELCDGCREYRNESFTRQAKRSIARTLAWLGDKLGLWDYHLGHGYWCVIVKYKPLTPNYKLLHILFPNRAAPF